MAPNTDNCIINDKSMLREDLIVSDVIASFKSVIDALKLEDVYFKTPNGKASVTSCLISL